MEDKKEKESPGKQKHLSKNEANSSIQNFVLYTISTFSRQKNEICDLSLAKTEHCMKNATRQFSSKLHIIPNFLETFIVFQSILSEMR